MKLIDYLVYGPERILAVTMQPEAVMFEYHCPPRVSPKAFTAFLETSHEALGDHITRAVARFVPGAPDVLIPPNELAEVLNDLIDAIWLEIEHDFSVSDNVFAHYKLLMSNQNKTLAHAAVNSVINKHEKHASWLLTMISAAEGVQALPGYYAYREGLETMCVPFRLHPLRGKGHGVWSMPYDAVKKMLDGQVERAWQQFLVDVVRGARPGVYFMAARALKRQNATHLATELFVQEVNARAGVIELAEQMRTGEIPCPF